MQYHGLEHRKYKRELDNFSLRLARIELALMYGLIILLCVFTVAAIIGVIYLCYHMATAGGH